MTGKPPPIYPGKRYERPNKPLVLDPRLFPDALTLPATKDLKLPSKLSGTKFDDPNYDPWDSVAAEMIKGDTEEVNKAAEESRKYIAWRRKNIKDEMHEMERKIVPLQQQALEAKGLTDWLLTVNNKLERIDQSAWHKLTQAAREGRLFTADDEPANWIVSYLEEPPQLFLMQTPWAEIIMSNAATDNGKRIEKMEYRLPFERCCFDFKLSGRHVLILCHTDPVTDRMQFTICIESGSLWFIGMEYDLLTFFEEFLSNVGKNDIRHENYILDEIAALCICLEAEVLTTEIIRAPHKLNAARVKQGRAPLLDHRVVSLKRRPRPAADPNHVSDGSRVGKTRLHFRRGHWRHFTDTKTWIKWMLVGNPDLGFVSHEYRA